MSTNAEARGGDLVYLRGEGLRTALLFSAIGIYAWYAVIFPGSDGYGPGFLAPTVGLVGLAAAFVTRRKRPAEAAGVLVACLVSALLLASWLGGLRVAPYMLAAVLGMAGLLFSMRWVLYLTALCSVLVLAAGVLHGHPLLTPETLAPVMVIACVGITSALSVRNLYTALYWAWESASAARRDQEELRERRAELARTARALDEACQRLELMNYELAQAREAAEEARLLKQQFTNNVSHELRTPLNVIVAFSEMMHLSPESYGGVPLPPEYRGDVQEIYLSSQHLLRLIDDVLDLSQLESQHIKLRLEPVRPADVIAEAVDIMKPLVRGKPVALQADAPDDLPSVYMDRARIRQVLLNLLNNARRFTDRGAITVSARIEEGQLRIIVMDTGIGIAPADHEKVFEEFRQIDGSTTRRADGTGLGLAISKRFVEMHGGRIWVESEGVPGLGSRFTFTLPLARVVAAEPQGLQRTPLALKEPAGRGRTLLALGCDESTVHLLEQGLEHYHLLPVADVAALPVLVEQCHPHALVINATLGHETWQEVHDLRQRAGPDVPIVLLPLVNDRRMAQELGVEDYLIKPISRAAISQLLARLGKGVRCILVIDDDTRMARVLARMIRGVGHHYRVLSAYDGEDGLRRMRRDQPDLVLLDLVMPGLDGYAVLAAMRQDPALHDIPVVIVTAQERTPVEERRLSSGTLTVSQGVGLTNEEALIYLRALLDAMSTVALRRRPSEAGESG